MNGLPTFIFLVYYGPENQNNTFSLTTFLKEAFALVVGAVIMRKIRPRSTVRLAADIMKLSLLVFKAGERLRFAAMSEQTVVCN